MTLLRGILLLLTLLAAQAGLYRIWPEAPRYVDLMLLPPLWYGLSRSQRSAMIVGCSAGLIQDAWFGVQALGLNGFKKTVIGWLVGAVGTRFDLNNALARLVAGFSASLAESLLDLVLRRLLDLHSAVPGIGTVLSRAAVTGILVVAGFSMADRVRRSRFAQRWA